MPGRRLLALDLGSILGFAVFEEKDAGDWLLTGAGTESPGKEADCRELKYAALFGIMERLLHDHHPDIVAFEDVRHHRHFTYVPFLTGVLCVLCERRGVSYVGVNVAELKKWATGRGNAGKGMMVEAAENLIANRGFWEAAPDEITHDQADALLVGIWATENAL